ncbi:hypothetical protein ALC57_12561 [Trachymyrmex cornetzi]|uniref:Uncharacterized protein n=1 Tax=Trachymyrmex cornetzi TaxID=471704 RepID=A0A151J197_9HYME|nr:hypothetical protein ALC57_12561 [Trachymyrmex cornetzi]
MEGRGWHPVRQGSIGHEPLTALETTKLLSTGRCYWWCPIEPWSIGITPVVSTLLSPRMWVNVLKGRYDTCSDGQCERWSYFLSQGT